MACASCSLIGFCACAVSGRTERKTRFIVRARTCVLMMLSNTQCYIPTVGAGAHTILLESSFSQCHLDGRCLNPKITRQFSGQLQVTIGATGCGNRHQLWRPEY